MNGIFDFLVRHGVAVLFLAVFVEQVGVPLPAAPWLLAAGALAATGKINWLAALPAATLGSVLADLIWFYMGRYYGNRILGLLCKINLQPDSGVRRTREFFMRYKLRGLIAAKFVPGLSALVIPMAGNSSARVHRFVLYDAASALLYTLTYLVLGAVFSRQLEAVLRALAGLGHGALLLLLTVALFYIGYKYYQRHKLLGELRMARITADELYQRQEAGEELTILDLRPHLEFEQNPLLIRGARHRVIEEMRIWAQEIPHDRDIILCCTCPNEASSARMAAKLHNNGLKRVRPLLGGMDGWRKKNYPTAEYTAVSTETLRAGVS
jgi:membrane protein DedA with SNARE-associated domain/rhodanese-related sulfurtransferase